MVPELIKPVVGGIGLHVSFRSLFMMLCALAMMVAPLTMPAGRAAAAAPHHGAMAGAGHCGEKSDTDRSHKTVDDGCCAAMCLGLSMATAMAGEPLPYDASALRPGAAPFRRGYLGEIATPPPRLS